MIRETLAAIQEETLLAVAVMARDVTAALEEDVEEAVEEEVMAVVMAVVEAEVVAEVVAVVEEEELPC